MELMGLFGTLFLAFCGLPQAIKTYRVGHAKDLSTLFLLLWLFGEILLLMHTIKYIDIYLIFNYLVNILIVGTLIKYKFFPRWGRKSGVH